MTIAEIQERIDETEAKLSEAEDGQRHADDEGAYYDEFVEPLQRLLSELNETMRKLSCPKNL